MVHHYHQGEAWREERTFAELAGEHAAEQYANEDALRFFERAVDLIDKNESRALSLLLLKHEDVAYTSGNRTAQQADLARLWSLVQGVAGDLGEDLYGEVLLRKGNYARVVNDYDQANEDLLRAAQTAEAAGNTELLARVRNCLGKTYWRQNRYDEAGIQLRHALSLATDQADDAQVADNLYHLGLIDYSRSEYAGALALFERAHERYLDAGDRKGVGLCLSMFGAIHNNLGDYVAAQETYAKGLDLCRSIGWRHMEAHYLALIGNNDLDIGRHELASASHGKALSLTRDLGDREGEALSLDVLGLIAHEQQALAKAVGYFEQAITLQESIGDRAGLGYSITHLGYTQVALGEFDEAVNSFERAISLRQAIDERGPPIDSLAGAALAVGLTGEKTLAAERAQQILDQIVTEGDEGIEYPIRVYLILHQILKTASAQDPDRIAAARGALEAGHRMLQARAAAIVDESQRQSYLDNVSFNRELGLAWTEHVTRHLCRSTPPHPAVGAAT